MVAVLVCKRWKTCVEELLAQEINTICLGNDYYLCSESIHSRINNNILVVNDLVKCFPNQLLSKLSNIQCISLGSDQEIDLTFLISIEKFYEKLECLHLDEDCIKFYNDSESTSSDSDQDSEDEERDDLVPNAVRMKWIEWLAIIGHKLKHLSINCYLKTQMIELLIESSINLQKISIYGLIDESLLTKISKTLKNFEIRNNETQFRSDLFLNTLAKNNGKHLLELNIEIPLTNRELNLIGNKFSNLQKISIRIMKEINQKPFNRMVEKLVHLRCIKIEFYKVLKRDVCDYYLQSIFETGSKSIETFYLQNAFLSTKTLSIVFERMIGIKSLTLNIINWSENCIQDHKTHFDCDICYEERKFWHFLFYLTSLRKLYIRKTYIPRIIFKNICSLKNLQLFDFDYLVCYGIKFIEVLLDFRLENSCVTIIVRTIETLSKISSNSRKYRKNIKNLKICEETEMKLFKLIAEANKIRVI